MGNTYADNASSIFEQKQERAASILRPRGLTQWDSTRRKYEADANNLGNYMSAGEYASGKNGMYRSSATKAVEDLNSEIERYGKTSAQGKTLAAYRDYYQKAIGDIDRIDIGTKVNEYLGDRDSWHSAEDYNTQKTILQDSIAALQKEMDEIENKDSSDYRSLKGYYDWYSELLGSLDADNDYYANTFKDEKGFENYRRARDGDYQYTANLRSTIAQEQQKLADAGLNADATVGQIDALISDLTWNINGGIGDTAANQKRLAALGEARSAAEHLSQLNEDLKGATEWQDSLIRINYGGYDSGTDYEKLLAELEAARQKTEEGSEDREKIDAQIRAIAGVNGDGKDANGLYDSNTWLGRQIMSNFDVESAQKELDVMDEIIDLYGKEQQLRHELLMLQSNVASEEFLSKEEQLAMAQKEIDDIVAEREALQREHPDYDLNEIELRGKRLDLSQRVLSSSNLQAQNRIGEDYSKLSDEEKAALIEEGKKHFDLADNVYVGSNGMGRKIANVSDLDDEMGGGIRDMLYAAIGAEYLGKDIGYTALDVKDAYEAQINDIAGYKLADKINNYKSGVGRWSAQVLGMGAQAGLNQFVQGVKQTFSDDYIAPNKIAAAGAYTRQNLSQYGDADIFGSNISQILYDTTQTTANMLPMIAASYLTSGALGAAGIGTTVLNSGKTVAQVAGQLTGAGLMGVSSAGNAYNQALAEGWKKEDAREFSLIMGAAEAGMQYVIGGITGLGGVTEEGLLAAAKGINNAAIRIATETGIHILSETTEELAQNRLERYLTYTMSGKGDPDWLSWNDDDWYTVIVTALSTGAMEAPGTIINYNRNASIGKLASGETSLNEKQIQHLQSAKVMKQRAQSKLVANGIGEYMKGSAALTYTLQTIGTDLMEEGTAAYELASKMKSGKVPANAANLGELFQLVMTEGVQGDTAEARSASYDKRMAQLIGGAIKFNEIKRLTDTEAAAKARREEVVKANPGAQVLDGMTTQLVENGAPATADTTKVAAVVNKVLSGQSLSKSEMEELTSDGSAAKAARVVLGANNPVLKADMNSDVAEAVITKLISDMKTRADQVKAQTRMSVVQAAMDAGTKMEVNRATAATELGPGLWKSDNASWQQGMRRGSVVDNATRGEADVNWSTVGGGNKSIPASSVAALQSATRDVDIAEQNLKNAENMDFEKAAALAGKIQESDAEGAISPAEAQTVADLKTRNDLLQKRISRLSEIKIPSKEQRTELQDYRREYAENQRKLESITGSVETKLAEAAKARAEAEKAPSETAKPEERSATDVAKLPTGGEITREQFLKGKEDQEAANRKFDEMLAQTGGTVSEAKETVAEKKTKKPKPVRAKLDGKAAYWTGGVLEGVEYDATTAEEAEKLLGKTELAFVNDVLAKVANVTLIKSKLNEDGEFVGANGIFYADGRIYLDVNAGLSAEGIGQRSIVLAAAHELTHFIHTYNEQAYNTLRDFVTSELKQKGVLDERIKAQQDNYRATTGEELDPDGAIEEVVADACEMMLTDSKQIQKFAAEHQTEAKTILEWLSDFFQKIADEFGKLVAQHPEAKAMQDRVSELRDQWLPALSGANENAARSTAEDTVQDVTNAEGNVVATTNEEGQGVFSLRTYDEGGRAALDVFLAKQVKKNALDQTQADEIRQQMETLYDICKKYDDGTYAPFSEWSNATVVEIDGKPVFSVVKQNGEYKLNLDFSLVCKKRRALDAVFNEMISRGLMNKIVGDKAFLEMGQASIAQINNIIREHGFETACALCFVDSKRFRQALIADAFVSMYNEQVNSLTEGTGKKATYFNYGGDRELLNTYGGRTGIETLPDFELNWSKVNDILANGKKGTVEYKIAEHLKNNPSERKLTSRGDFMSTAGFDALNVNNPELLSLYNSKKGAGGPKAAQSDVQYLNDIIKKGAFNLKAAYSVGGVRIQGFSDYVGRLVFDYIQMVGDLSAKKLPAHAYTKEFLFAQQFGMTGIKINMSLVPEVVEGGVAPGLDANGNYTWKDGQSFGSTVYDNNGKRMTAQQGYELAVQIQNADGYSANCGTIAVGVSREHILKMLGDPNIRMVIPYHKSSLNHLVAAMNQIDAYTDYTNAQNTRKKNADGKWVKLDKGEKDFNWNETLQRLEREGKGAREAAAEYKKWCAENGYLPKFDEFAYHENYYKLLEDFTAYDKNGAPAPLSGVKMNFPGEDSAFGSMENLIKSGLEEDAMLQAKQEKGVQDIVNEIEATLPAWEAQLAEQGEQFAIESGRQSLERTRMRDTGAKLSPRARLKDDSPHTYKTHKNGKSVFTTNELIDLSDSRDSSWTGNRLYVTMSMDEAEMQQFYRSIEKLTSGMPEYGADESIEPIIDTFEVDTPRGKFQYTVSLDGRMHGEVLEKRALNALKNTSLLTRRKTNASRRSTNAQRNETGGRTGSLRDDGQPVPGGIQPTAGTGRSDTANAGLDRSQSGRDYTAPTAQSSRYPAEGRGLQITKRNSASRSDTGYSIDGKSVSPEAAQAQFSSRDATHNVWSVPVTEEMRDSVLHTGQPLFSLARPGNESDTTSLYPEGTLQNDLLNLLKNGSAEDVTNWVNEQMANYDDKLENAKIKPPVIPTKGFVPKVSAEEKSNLNKTLQEKIEQYGKMRPSEKSNGLILPKRLNDETKVRRGAQNIGSAKNLPQDANDLTLREVMTNTELSYVPDSNKALIKDAKSAISDMGLESSVKTFLHNAKTERDAYSKAGLQNIALGEQLLIETARNGDMASYVEVLGTLCELGTAAGKTLQAFRLLKQSGPIGQLYYVQKAIDRLNKQNEDKIEHGRYPKIVAKDDLCQAVIMADTAEERDKAMDALIADLAKQAPVTLRDRWNAWRYLSMLGNARTHVRNFFGNGIFVPLLYTKDLMAAGGEFLATKVGLMDEADRRKSLTVSKEYRDFAARDAEVMKKELQGNGKYNPSQAILEARKLLPGFLEKFRRFNGDMLELEDWWFLRREYKAALGQALMHSGFTVEELETTPEGMKALSNARRTAILEAQKATYRDFNAVASALNRIKHIDSGAGKIVALGLEGVLPFTKTPMNILRRGVEYSPIGIMAGVSQILSGVRNGNLDVAEAIDKLAAGLTGTGVAILGWLLANMGVLRGKKSDDKEENFEKLQGYQDYSLQIGDASFTIDWAAPTALPLFTGAALSEMMNSGEELTWKTAWNSMMMLAEPMMSLSMLDGINNVISSTSYAGENEKLAAIGQSAATSYLGQAFPTILGQLARSIDGTRRSTYVDKNSPVPDAIQRFVQTSVQAKTPGWESQKAAYIDAWGRESTAGSKALNGIENFLAPWYRSMKNVTDTDEEIQRLYSATKDIDPDLDILPKAPKTSVEIVGKRLTAEQYVQLATDMGQTKYQLLSQMFSDPRYLALSDIEKAKAIEYIYTYADRSAKYHVDSSYNLHNQGVWIEEAEAASSESARFEIIWEKIRKALED